MVAVNDLQGVAEVIRQPNGSLTLIMNSGQRIDMAAADVALENGRVVVDIDSLMELLGNDSGLLVPLSQLPDVQTWELLPDGNVLITRPDGTQMVIERGALVQQGDLFLISPSNALQQGIASGEDFGNLLFVPSASFATQPSSTSSFPSTASSSSEPVSSFGDIPPLAVCRRRRHCGRGLPLRAVEAAVAVVMVVLPPSAAMWSMGIFPGPP
ncbi:hypothetical protein DK37_00645 [Halomonas sp. SUBG004]|nr:hypothetical protein DK37_00645 [Halomonas sp. SUBG004]